MNLSTEYLVRSGAIKNLFQTPCTLFLVELMTRIGKVLSFRDDPGDPSFCTVCFWDLGRMAHEESLPEVISFSVPKAETFSDPRVILPRHRPIPFIDQPISPVSTAVELDDLNLSELHEEFFNPEEHRRARREWLWIRFVKLHINSVVSKDYTRFSPLECSRIIRNEQYYIRTRNKPLWKKWDNWVEVLLIEPLVAAELVFTGLFT